MLCLCCVFFLILRVPPCSTRPYTLFPDTTLFRSVQVGVAGDVVAGDFALGPGAPAARTAGGIQRIPGMVGAVAAVVVAAERGIAIADPRRPRQGRERSEEHTSELQSLMRTSYAVFCLKKKKNRLTKSVRN